MYVAKTFSLYVGLGAKPIDDFNKKFVNKTKSDEGWILFFHNWNNTENTFESKTECITEDRILVWVKRIFIHAAYDPASNGVNDIALLQLENAVKFSDDIIPLCLPENGSAIENKLNCKFAGWGNG